MDNQLFVCVYFDGIILTTTVGCISECRQQIAMRFNRNVSLDGMKGRINAKIVRRCGRRISKLFYKVPVSTDPIKFTEMELVNDEDVETMITFYSIRGIDIDLNVSPDIDVVGDDGYNSSDPCDQEVDSDNNPDVNDVPDDIDDADMNDDGNINTFLIGNQM
ncbi:hypothetical protein PVK06_023051 [Gossypium arboreum]|uniref:Uncharacterized protein n=1 Tax=Gossypium arboreum TaxID=29729 RepID=A0ABR0PA76_GOSAR|nr:hypothetical protein PVK06_023051 [Gossypium arboreum]